MLEREIHRRLRGYVGYRATRAINGIGSTLAAILLAEIGDVTSRCHCAAARCRPSPRS
jgi:transposase